MQAQPGGSVALPRGSAAPSIEVGFNPPAAVGEVSIEVLTGAELMARVPHEHRRMLQRVRLHLLIVCLEGHGSHWVDFTSIALEPGTVLHVQPGQVQRFEDLSAVDAHVLIWPAEVQPTATPWFAGLDRPTAFAADAGDLQRLTTWIEELRSEQMEPSRATGPLPRAILTVILLLLQRMERASTEHGSVPDAFRDLRRALEAQVLTRPSVATIASELGYSTKTLDRAAQRAVGQTAKQVIDQRIDLELRRRLADPGQPISAVRDVFGFPDSSSFTKFARRHLGEPPGDFRRRYV